MRAIIIMLVLCLLTTTPIAAQDFLQSGQATAPEPVVLLPVEVPEPIAIRVPPDVLYFDPLCQCVTHTPPAR